MKLTLTKKTVAVTATSELSVTAVPSTRPATIYIAVEVLSSLDPAKEPLEWPSAAGHSNHAWRARGLDRFCSHENNGRVSWRLR
jgi:hypothetical protein